MLITQEWNVYLKLDGCHDLDEPSQSQHLKHIPRTTDETDSDQLPGVSFGALNWATAKSEELSQRLEIHRQCHRNTPHHRHLDIFPEWI